MSQTQNVQRGLIFMIFIHALFLFILTIFKFCKNKLDPITDEEPEGEGEAAGKYKESEPKGPEGKESTDNISNSPDFDTVAVKSEPAPDAEAAGIERLFHSAVDFRNFYTPVFILAVVNIVTGTSKAFCFILYIAATIWVILFNVAKLHRSCCGDSKIVNVLVENVWLILSFFFFVNHWAAFTVMMPYVVI